MAINREAWAVSLCQGVRLSCFAEVEEEGGTSAQNVADTIG